jgi:hypothetical protein
MEYQPSGSASAACALHPDQPAQSICGRCGNFMCATCTEHGTYEACPTCREITGDVPGFTWTRSQYSLDGIFSFAWERFTREWVMLSLAALIFLVVIAAFSFVSQLLQLAGTAVHPAVGGGMGVVGSVLQSILQATLTGGFMVVIYDVMKGRQVDLGRMFGQFSNLGTYAVVTLLMMAIVFGTLLVVGLGAGVGWLLGQETGLAIGIGAGTVLIIVPAIWLALPFMFVEMEVALGGEKRGVQVLTNAFRLAEAHRLWMLLFWFIGFLITLFGVLLCCVGLLPALALGNMLKTGLYLALRNGSGLPPLRGQVQ